jgi:hypothetical protein
MIDDTGRDGAFTAHDFKSVYTPSSDYVGLRSKLVRSRPLSAIRRKCSGLLPNRCAFLPVLHRRR